MWAWDGVLDKESGYAAIGFRQAYRNIRFENWSDGRPGRPRPLISLNEGRTF
jgi:hypothetical protein